MLCYIKKEEAIEIYESSYFTSFNDYSSHFKVYRRSSSVQAFSYMTGLIGCERGKANMERMEEHIEKVAYHQYQHFISHSDWSSDNVITQVGQDLSSLLSKEKEKTEKPTGLIIDESSHLKSGTKSVGVARQYAGTIGKVDNCQVGVYCSLVNGEYASLVSERLFLPKKWVEDTTRLEEAKVPLHSRNYATKPELALDMIDDLLKNNISFDWVGGDGLYGHNYALGKGLDQRKLLFVLDIHKDQLVYLEEPLIIIPQKTSNKGRPISKRQTESSTVRVDAYLKSLSDDDWAKVLIRKTTKGWLKAWVHIKEVWVWDKEEASARKRVLVLRKTITQNGKDELKYSLSNGEISNYSIEDFAYFQAQRYWVERNFDDAKNELGMSDYQVRKWIGWHHHHAIMLMAMLFMLKERIGKQIKYPLMSVRDARILVTTLIAETMLSEEPEMLKQIRMMKKRHQKRQKDIDRYF